MRAIRVNQSGGPEVMRVEQVPTPEPGEGQVRVRIEAAGLNFIDIYERSGQYNMRFPFTPGSEASGVVDAVGQNVVSVTTGERVSYTNVPGAYAEYAIVPADRLVHIPEEVDGRTAAAVMLQGMTAHYLATTLYPLHHSDVALVHAGAGGVGGLLVQIAKMRGARVLATAGSDEKAQIARDLGADEVILYQQQNFAEEARRLTNGQGVTVVYDSVGQATFDRSLDALRPRGYMVLFGQSSGAVPPFNLQVLNAKGSLFITRPTLRDYIASRDELLRRADDLFTWIASGQLKVRVDRTFPLAEAGAAHEYMAGRNTKGKVLLIPGE